MILQDYYYSYMPFNFMFIFRAVMCYVESIDVCRLFDRVGFNDTDRNWFLDDHWE